MVRRTSGPHAKRAPFAPKFSQNPRPENDAAPGQQRPKANHVAIGLFLRPACRSHPSSRQNRPRRGTHRIRRTRWQNDDLRMIKNHFFITLIDLIFRGARMS